MVSCMQDYIKLQNGISWKNEVFVQKTLDNNKNLDILFDNGVLFQMSIDNGSCSIIRSLLEYFKSNQLSKYSVGSYEYSSLNQKMYDIIKTATEDVELSQEMEAVLNPYLSKEEEDYQEDCEDLFNTTTQYSLGDNFAHFEATGDIEVNPMGNTEETDSV